MAEGNALYGSIAAQTVLFGQSVLLGVGCGLYYDLLRAVRRRSRGRLTALLDGLFWLGVLIAFALFVLICADGSWRSYILLGLGGGLVLYFLTLSRPVLSLWEGVLAVVLTLLGSMLSVLRAALGTVLTVLRCVLSLPLRRLRRLRRGFCKIHQKNFKKILPFLREKV